MRYFQSIVFSLLILFCSCGRNSDSGSVKAPLIRLDKIIADFERLPTEQQFALVDTLSVPLNDYIYLMGASTGDITASIDSLSHTAAYRMFEPEIDKSIPSTDTIEQHLGTINLNLKKTFSELPSYSYFGVISPYRQQIMLVDSVVYIALNHYLGENHPAYNSMPEYLRATKRSEYIPVDVAEAIMSVEFPYKESDTPSAIQYYLYEGAMLNAVATITGIDDIALLMGWSRDQLNQVSAKEEGIWQKMAADNLIYTTDMTTARRLCEPSPVSRQIDADLPGRIGRYIGYRIVQAYLKNNQGTTTKSMLTPDFYNNEKTLIKSGYSPK